MDEGRNIFIVFVFDVYLEARNESYDRVVTTGVLKEDPLISHASFRSLYIII